MSVTQHPAATSLLASPSMQAASDPPNFDVVARGYHRGQVDEWRHWAAEELRRAREEAEHLASRVIPFVGHELESPQGQRLLAELIQLAADEITGQQAAAAEEVAQMIAGARQQAEGVIAEARSQADGITAKATQQAATLVNNARTDAKKTTDDASAHAAAVHEAAGQRLAQFTKIHEDGLTRLAQVNKVTADVLAAETERGSLQDEVDKALAAISRR